MFASVDSAAVTAVPLTMCAWMKSDGDAATLQVVGWIGDKDVADHYYQLSWGQGATNDPSRASARGGGSESIGEKQSVVTADAWFHICAVFTSTTSRTSYANASAGTANTTSTTVSGSDRTAIGMNRDSTPSAPFGGKIAEFCIWDIALSGADITNLYNSGKGTPCTNVQSADLVGYYPLRTDANDSTAGARHMTTSGSPTFDATDHPGTTDQSQGVFLQ